MLTKTKIKHLSQKTKRLRLLYVEDNINAQKETFEVLSLFFEDIHVAVNGEIALELYYSYKFDLILTDINMPNMNGIDMIKIIKEEDASMPILVLTAHSECDYLNECIKLNVNGYIIKPMNLRKFVKILEKIVNTIITRA